MKIDDYLIQEASLLLEVNKETIAKVEAEVCSVGCSWCANCSGIVGG